MGRQPASELLFLEVRFGVLAGYYLPGQVLERDTLCIAYQLKLVGVTEVLNTLVLEGYLQRTRPGHYTIKAWSREAIADLYDMRASLEGIAAAKAAARASDIEIAMLKNLVEEHSALSLDTAEGVEQAIHIQLRFHAEIIRISRVSGLPEMARTFLPNALNRRIFWAQDAKSHKQSLRAQDKIVAAIAERNASMARLLMREAVYASREAVLAEIDTLAARPAAPIAEIHRIGEPVSHNGKIFGLGRRDAAADGKVIPLRSLAAQI